MAKIVRIGFRPAQLPLSRGDSALNVAMERLPTTLGAISVSSQPICPANATDLSGFELWEQARAALLATIVARDANPAIATNIVYRRQLSFPGERLLWEDSKTNHGRTSRPFLAVAPASHFATDGYLTEENGSRAFFAPDADVLLDDSFAVSHCFRRQAADNAHRSQIGVAFTPARQRDDVVDVTGVMWMSEDEPRLVSVDFAYTEVEPALSAAGAGGRLEFETAPNGVSFISQWYIRIPAGTIMRGPNTLPPRHRRENDRVRVIAVDLSGGVVASARWPDGSVWNATTPAAAALAGPRVLESRPSDQSAGHGARILGAVHDAVSGMPLRGALVMLSKVDRAPLTDSMGRFQFADVPAGTVVVQLRHVGHAPLTDTLRLGAGQLAERSYAMTRLQVLDTVRAMGTTRQYGSPGLRGFEERRRMGAGTFIDDSVLRANDAARLSDVLAARAPGLRMLRSGTGTYVVSARDQRRGRFAIVGGVGRRKGNVPDACFATIYLDGALVFDVNTNRPTDEPPKLDDYFVRELGAVEFYAGPASTPAQFKSSECGTLLLWTRDK